jgi:hypothetical protein
MSVFVIRDRKARIVSTFRLIVRPSKKPASVPDDADRGSRDEEDAHDRAARRAHGSQDRDVGALSFTSMMRPEHDVQASATMTISVRIRNITLRSTCKTPKGAVALTPIGQDHRPVDGSLDRGLALVDLFGIGGPPRR